MKKSLIFLGMVVFLSVMVVAGAGDTPIDRCGDLSEDVRGNVSQLLNDGETVVLEEWGNITDEDYTIIGGRLFEITQIYNNTGSSYSDDKIFLQDVVTTRETYSTTFVSEGNGTVVIDGKSWGVYFRGDGL